MNEKCLLRIYTEKDKRYFVLILLYIVIIKYVVW
nr:MAG TPA: hypothetical protein [Caudoviricetes sp.]